MTFPTQIKTHDFPDKRVDYSDKIIKLTGSIQCVIAIYTLLYKSPLYNILQLRSNYERRHKKVQSISAYNYLCMHFVLSFVKRGWLT